MTPHLDWTEDYDKIWYAPIFLDYSLRIYHNGEDYCNVELYDNHGNEEYAIAGGETIEEAKQSALDWLTEELKKATN